MSISYEALRGSIYAAFILLFIITFAIMKTAKNIATIALMDNSKGISCNISLIDDELDLLYILFDNYLHRINHRNKQLVNNSL